ncbi:hypothetical protein MKZ38_005911 [Zalerion maritima]|uniref:Ubiquitin-like protease family profile domain-containing protein n=1 Tax=Zalerion maritima TaxID=339359 RepID=A0AAD5RKS1_9PEZI|nr:hypothetical protein MKZ38_005911 [Zalerion maritima]
MTPNTHSQASKKNVPGPEVAIARRPRLCLADQISALVQEATRQSEESGTASRKQRSIFSKLVKRCNERFAAAPPSQREPVALYIYTLFPGEATDRVLRPTVSAVFSHHFSRLSPTISGRLRQFVNTCASAKTTSTARHIASPWDVYLLFGHRLVTSAQALKRLNKLVRSHPGISFPDFYTAVLDKARSRLRLNASVAITVGSAQPMYILEPKDINVVVDSYFNGHDNLPMMEEDSETSAGSEEEDVPEDQNNMKASRNVYSRYEDESPPLETTPSPQSSVMDPKSSVSVEIGRLAPAARNHDPETPSPLQLFHNLPSSPADTLSSDISLGLFSKGAEVSPFRISPGHNTHTLVPVAGPAGDSAAAKEHTPINTTMPAAKKKAEGKSKRFDLFHVGSFGRVELTARDRAVLVDPSGWLNDHHIDWYNHCLLEQYFYGNKPATLHLSSCLRFPNLNKLPKTVVWVVHPLWTSKHWSVVFVRLPRNDEPDDGAVFLANSLPNMSQPLAKATEIMAACKVDGHVTVVDCARQTNGDDCGVLTTHFIDLFLAQYSENMFTMPDLHHPANPTLLRRRMLFQFDQAVRADPFASVQLPHSRSSPSLSELAAKIENFTKVAGDAQVANEQTREAQHSDVRLGREDEQQGELRMEFSLDKLRRARTNGPIGYDGDIRAARAEIQDILDGQEQAAEKVQLARWRLSCVEEAEGIATAVVEGVANVVDQGLRRLDGLSEVRTKEMLPTLSVGPEVSKEGEVVGKKRPRDEDDKETRAAKRVWQG